MLPYISLILISLFFIVLNVARVKGSEDAGLVVIALVMTLVAGFRGLTVGTDTLLYSNMYYRIAGCSDLSDAFPISTITAPVYVSYAWVLGRIGFSHQALLLFNALITNIGIAYFIKRSSNRPLISILVYVCLGMFFQSLNGMRQYVAVALALNAYLDFCLYGVRKIRAWILIVLALGIHATALMIFPCVIAALYIRNGRHNRKSLLIVLSVAAFFSSALVVLSDVFMRLFPIYSMYNGVQNAAIFSGLGAGRIRYLYAALLGISIFGIASFGHRDGASCNDDRIFILFPLCVVSGVVGLVYGASPLINRLLWFCLPGHISMIPSVVDNTEKGWAQLLKLGIFLILAVWFVAQLTENQDDMLPYVIGIGLFE